MRIAVNTRFLLPQGLEGIGTFAHETLQRMVRQHPEHEFIFIFDRAYDPAYLYAPNVKPVVAFPQARHPYLYYVYFEFVIPYLLGRHKADLFFSPDGYLSLRTAVPQVQVIHDISFEHYPQDISRSGAWHYTTFFPQFARIAKRIATVSEYSKQDIVSHYAIDPAKIDVVYCGANSLFKPVAAAQQEHTREKYTGGAPYFVYVGAIQPRKNIVNLLKAYDVFRASSGVAVKLVIVGRKAWKNEAMEQAFNRMQYKDEVIFTGRLSQDELVQVTGSALALTYVSYFEGFGIPIVEAMNTDIPVICSGITSMPEAAGEAALYVDPFSVESIAAAMTKLAKDPALHKILVESGRMQREKFSWDKTATKLWQTIEKSF